MALEPISLPRTSLDTTLETAGHTGSTIGVTRQGSSGLGTSADTDAFSRQIDQAFAGSSGEAVRHVPSPLETRTLDPAARVNAARANTEEAPVNRTNTETGESAPVSADTQRLLDRAASMRDWSKDSVTTGYGTKTSDTIEARIGGDGQVAYQTERLDRATRKLREADISGDEDKITAAAKELTDTVKDLDNARKDIEKTVTTARGNQASKYLTPASVGISAAGLVTSATVGGISASLLHDRLKENSSSSTTNGEPN